VNRGIKAKCRALQWQPCNLADETCHRFRACRLYTIGRVKHLCAGFTLIELLVTMAVAAILLSMAVPAFSSFVQNDRDVGQINSLAESFSYARSEAVKRNSPSGIIVCPSVDGLVCSGTNWSAGWIVLDLNAADPPPLVLQAVPALSGVNTLNAVGAAAGVTFLSSGLVAAPLTIGVCDMRGAHYSRDVEVNATGRVASSQTPGQSVSGTALTCP
jgi:type IV fimbrial biogenesis protein FimT